MSKTSSAGKPAQAGEFSEMLLANGFRPDKLIASEPRERGQARKVYVRGYIRVLTGSSDRPFYTVQRRLGTRVWWFVDFPYDVSLRAIKAFLDACEE